MKQIDYNTFIDLLSKQDCYFVNSYEKAMIRSILKDGKIRYFVKFKGEEEFEAKEGNGVVAEGIREHTTITKEEYENY